MHRSTCLLILWLLCTVQLIYSDEDVGNPALPPYVNDIIARVEDKSPTPPDPEPEISKPALLIPNSSLFDS